MTSVESFLWFLSCNFFGPAIVVLTAVDVPGVLTLARTAAFDVAPTALRVTSAGGGVFSVSGVFAVAGIPAVVGFPAGSVVNIPSPIGVSTGSGGPTVDDVLLCSGSLPCVAGRPYYFAVPAATGVPKFPDSLLLLTSLMLLSFRLLLVSPLLWFWGHCHS